MRRIGWGVAAALAALGLWRGVRPPASAEPQPPRPSGWTLRLGHALGEDSPVHAGALRLAEEAAELSGGRLSVLVEPNRAWQDRVAIERAVRDGGFHLMVLPAVPLSASVPEMEHLSFPFLFPSRDLCHEMLDDEPGKLLLARMDRLGLMGAAFWDGAFRQVSADRELRTPEEMRPLRIGVPWGSRGEGLLRAYGSHPIPIPAYRLRGEWGAFALNGVDLTADLFLESGLDAVQSHLVLLNHAYAGQVVCLPRRILDRLPPALQDALLEAVHRATAFERKSAGDRETEVLRRIEERGVRVVRLTDLERRRFWEAARSLPGRKKDAPGSEILARALELRSALLHEGGR